MLSGREGREEEANDDPVSIELVELKARALRCNTYFPLLQPREFRYLVAIYQNLLEIGIYFCMTREELFSHNKHLLYIAMPCLCVYSHSKLRAVFVLHRDYSPCRP